LYQFAQLASFQCDNIAVRIGIFVHFIVFWKTKAKNMRHILIHGEWQHCSELIEVLHQSDLLVSLCTLTEVPPADLLVARLDSASSITLAAQSGLPWLAWTEADAENLTTQAYQAGAQAVFPNSTPASVIFNFIQRYLETHQPAPAPVPLEKAIMRRYQKGDTIQLDENSILEVHEGIIAQTMIHQDGAEVMLGLFGPTMLVVPHPEDTCYIQLMAHTNASTVLQPWETAVLDPIFPQKLRARLQQMEAWAAMQARPHLDQRVLGILSLLGEQFGHECEQGEMIDVRITHMQLASAVGATRTTITRTLGDLKNQNRLLLLPTEDGERFCLPSWQPGHHGLHG
jgi:DNA-binding NarL/FixJ family response regulator